jgi:alpha-beta hydrolase superfamily lysophospholipase
MKNFTLPIAPDLLLSGKEWTISDAKANLILIHGAGEHIGRYNHLATFFNGQRMNVFGTDHYGHGNSPGKRGHLPAYSLYLDEIARLIQKINVEFPELPLILYGHSMGGNIVLHWLLENEKTFDFAIISAPWIQLKLVPPKWKIHLMKLLGGLLPSLSQHNELDPHWLSHDEQVVSDYITDPLVHSEITLGAASALFAKAAYLHSYNEKIDVRVLVIHGLEDKITDPEASREFALRTGVDFHGIDGLYHEVHNEPDHINLFNYICNWLIKNGLS